MNKQVDDIKLKEAKAFFESLGINCYDIVLPIRSDVYCVKRMDKQWAAFKLGNKTPIVDFGKYNHMWGFDCGYCLVSVADNDRTTFANRGIIDSHGNEVVKPYTYSIIMPFYGKEEDSIIACTEGRMIGLNKRDRLKINNEPSPFRG